MEDYMIRILTLMELEAIRILINDRERLINEDAGE
jgi:hypothetical protein